MSEVLGPPPDEKPDSKERVKAALDDVTARINANNAIRDALNTPRNPEDSSGNTAEE
ncbi:MAG: hypothetical protein ACREHC_05435 [Candidatus Levyibacteriota bacterium]